MERKALLLMAALVAATIAVVAATSMFAVASASPQRTEESILFTDF